MIGTAPSLFPLRFRRVTLSAGLRPALAGAGATPKPQKRNAVLEAFPDVSGISRPVRQLMGKPPETTHFTRGRRRAATCGFSTSMKAARVDSLAIVAGGLRAKGRLSFKTGVFGDIELAKASRRALWDKNKNSKP